jgi:hypothetical protein
MIDRIGQIWKLHEVIFVVTRLVSSFDFDAPSVKNSLDGFCSYEILLLTSGETDVIFENKAGLSWEDNLYFVRIV